MAKKDKPFEDPAARRRTAEAYRAHRTKELKDAAEAAVGSPVEHAARFGTVPAGNFAMSIPFFGQLLALRKTAGVAKSLRGLGMLALDGESVYAIAVGRRAADRPVLVTWPRESVSIRSIAKAGTDSAVTFDAPGGTPSAFRLYCSSLPTNPWASDLVRALGGEPPPPIDPTALDYDAVDLPTV